MSAAGVKLPQHFKRNPRLTFPHGSLSLVLLVRSIPTKNWLTSEKGRLEEEFPKRGNSIRWSFLSTPRQNTALTQMDILTRDAALRTSLSHSSGKMER